MKKSDVEVEGPGYRRMKARLGSEAMEALRLRVLREQDEALAQTTRPAQPAASDRAGYRNYPATTGADERRARARRVRIRQIGGDDGYQWCLLIDGAVRYAGMTRAEAGWRRTRFVESGEL